MHFFSNSMHAFFLNRNRIQNTECRDGMPSQMDPSHLDAFYNWHLFLVEERAKLNRYLRILCSSS